MIAFILAILFVCAVAKPQSPRLEGGLLANEGQFPYLAQIKPIHPVVEEEKYALTGSIISDQWVLTSAIIEWLKPEDVMIVVGTNYNDDHNGWAYAVSDLIIHPNFGTSQTIDYNIGVIKIKGRIILGEYVKTIELSSSIRIPPNLSLVFAAWGTANRTIPSYSPNLQHVTLKSVTMVECKQYLPEYPFDDSSHFCSKALGGNGPCIGDMGAPIVYGNYQLGLDVSSTACDLTVHSNIFVNIGVHRSWIEEVTGV